jgi:Ni,Fe-hydrogenase III large subunit/Ni,Fe-hydrogenase III component G
MNIDSILHKYLPHRTGAASFGNLIICPVPVEEIVQVCASLYHEHGLPLKTITVIDERSESGCFRILYLFGLPREHAFLAPFIRVTQEFPTLTTTIHEASTYERKIKTLFGLKPVNHPDPRSLILHENWPADMFPLRKDFEWNCRPETAHNEFRFRELGGEGIYEIPVGPVHAGIIEPGHFRFSVAGEEILLLEPRLGYSHKGSEKLFEVLPLEEKLRLAERISGDSSFHHAVAFCQAIEALSGITIAAASHYLRMIYAELERLANHLGDIGAMMTDTGYNFGGAHCMRLREVVLQLNEKLTGSRFLRGVVRFGGVNAGLDRQASDILFATLESLLSDFADIIAIAENSSSLLNRLKSTGILPEKIARDHGVVGVAGRAVGFCADARIDYPYAAYDEFPFEIATETGGDVYARFRVRVKEVRTTMQLIQCALVQGPFEMARSTEAAITFPRNAFAVGVVEGWRGDIVYLVATNAGGEIARVDVRDPSFLNWTVVGHACINNIVPDFPLINKSFNLSYSGNDL